MFDNWSIVWDNRGALMSGLGVALQVAFVSLLISIVGGLVLAAMRMARPPFSWLAGLYINVFRGVPSLVGVIWVYFGLSFLIGVNFTVFQAGVIALVLLGSAYNAEIFRAALSAIPKGQREAGQALGMSRARIYTKIILPQTMKIAAPNIGSMFIGLVKDTSTFTVIGMAELVHVTQGLVSISYEPFVLYTAAALIYVGTAFAIDLLFRLIEGALTFPPKSRVAVRMRSRRISQTDALIKSLS